CQHYYSSPCSF
nr:immunoglobulin light chain junction region [Macaca mulatta]MPN91111.1 immunoglobulin light chain junction region [Macaca mulatta]MPN91138.1 immunoglobulin light chain junction region [Macaca mulatta]MPN91689.1 immunoglobulin light chain junction region [Macaca mulatta]MPN91964.1 immunoglobulin light chain junction region [Macaca mulatta]